MRPPPTPHLFFENNAGQLLTDPAGFLRVRWGSRPRRAGEAQELFGQLADALRRFGWSRVLVDQTLMLPFSPAEQQWVAQQWLPRAVSEAGYRHGAVLVSTQVLVRLATAYITSFVQGLPLLYASFDREEEALRWLLRQPRSAAPGGAARLA